MRHQPDESAKLNGFDNRLSTADEGLGAEPSALEWVERRRQAAGASQGKSEAYGGNLGSDGDAKVAIGPRHFWKAKLDGGLHGHGQRLGAAYGPAESHVVTGICCDGRAERRWPGRQKEQDSLLGKHFWHRL